MFEKAGRLIYRRRWWVLALTAVGVVFCAVWGSGVFAVLAGGGTANPGSESSRALQQIETLVGRNNPDVVMLFQTDDRKVDEASYRRGVEAALAPLPKDMIAKVQTYWSVQKVAPKLADRFVSADRTDTYAVLTLAGDTPDARLKNYRALEHELDRPVPGFDVTVGGEVAVTEQVNVQVEHDIRKAELLTAPIVLLLTIIVFGGLVAASMPLVVGGAAVVGAFAVLRLITLVTDVSIFSINVVTMLGLGLAIDYALFVVMRFREQLAKGDDVEQAIVTTMQTAGMTVAISGITVALSLASLTVFPVMLLRSMAFGGTAAVGVAMLAALTALPAVLAVLGERVNLLRIPRLARLREPLADLLHRLGQRPAVVRLTARSQLVRRFTAFLFRSLRAATHPGGEKGWWYRLGRSVMRRPLLYTLLLVPLILVLGIPFLRAELGGADYRALPAGAESRVVAETLNADFPATSGSDITIAVKLDRPLTGDIPYPDPATGLALQDYGKRLEKVPGVESVDIGGIGERAAIVLVHVPYNAQSQEARTAVERVAAVPAPPPLQIAVGGETAALLDLLDTIRAGLPWMGLVIAAVTFILLFMAFGSIVLPVKAVLMNVLSLSASYGAMVWIFQDGHLSDVLGFESMGYLEATQPVLLFAVLFGLSMDYELFLLSRVREEYDRTGDHVRAVAAGLQRTGRIITSAALLLIVVVAAFATSQVIFVKMISVGLIIAVIMDATVVRALLVPATMRLLGRATWWAPASMVRFWRRYGIREGDELHTKLELPEALIPAPREPLLTR